MPSILAWTDSISLRLCHASVVLCKMAQAADVAQPLLICIRNNTKVRDGYHNSVRSVVPDYERGLWERATHWDLPTDVGEEALLKERGDRILGCVVVAPLNHYVGALTQMSPDARLLWNLYLGPGDAYYIRIEDSVLFEGPAFRAVQGHWFGFATECTAQRHSCE